MSDRAPMPPASLAQAIEVLAETCAKSRTALGLNKNDLINLGTLAFAYAPEIVQALRRLSPVAFPLRWDLTPLEVGVLNEMLTRQLVTSADLGRLRGGATMPARRIIFNLRMKLVREGLVIETARGNGYYLTDETKAAVRRLCPGATP